MDAAGIGNIFEKKRLWPFYSKLLTTGRKFKQKASLGRRNISATMCCQIFLLESKQFWTISRTRCDQFTSNRNFPISVFSRRMPASEILTTAHIKVKSDLLDATNSII